MNKELPNITQQTVVFTRHARERMNLRKLDDAMVLQVMRKPGKIYDAGDGKVKFVGKAMGAKVHVIGKPIPEENKWVVVSLWARGENDAGEFVSHTSYRPQRKSELSSFYNRTFLIIILIVLIAYYWTQIR